MELRKSATKPELTAIREPLRAVPRDAEKLMQSSDWWTGKAPEYGVCPGVDSEGKIHSLPIPNLETCTRAEVQDYFDNSWTLTEVLLSGLAGPGIFYRVPYHGLRHPLVFYYLHPAVLYVNKLRLAGLIPSAVNTEFESIFETGVDEMSWDDMSKNEMKWPELPELHTYRKQVYKLVSNIIATHPDLDIGHAPVKATDPLWTLFMGFEHERIHIETSSVLIRELPIECVRPPENWPHLNASDQPSFPPIEGHDFPSNKFIAVNAGEAVVGKPDAMPHFGWDNEYGQRELHIDKFSTSQNLITNGEFYAFVVSGAYLQQNYWSETGWKWRSFRNTKFPTFWKPEGPSGYHQYQLRTIFEMIPMQWSWPALVNFYEAEAYCKWISEKSNEQYRLPTEAEHIRMRNSANDEHQLRYQNETGILQESVFNLNLVSGAERAVSQDLQGSGAERALRKDLQGSEAAPAVSRDLQGSSAERIGDLFGNVWQWCGDHFNPLPGFAVNKYYDDFSVPCFDGEHQMILGGSFISTGDEATSWARFHFRPHFFQHAGFRLVTSRGDGGVIKLGEESGKASNPYESNTILNEYLTLHFAPPEVQMPFIAVSQDLTKFPQRCAEVLLRWSEKLGVAQNRALDVGCAVGGASFRLADSFAEVTGVDLSQSFIDAAKQLQSDGAIKFEARTEGEKAISLEAFVAQESAQRITFRRADACALPPEFMDFDAVLLANLLCRLPSPTACLSRMSGPRGIVRRGGLLMMTTPFTWMENFTPKQLWFGGQQENERSSEQVLLERMSDDFELLEKFDMPLLIREHSRKYQLIFALATVWQRK